MSYNLTGAVYGGNITLGKAGLAAGTTSTYSIGTAFTYAIKGQLFSKGTVTNGASPVTDANTGVAFKPLAVNQAAIFAFAVDASGNVVVAQGPIASNADIVGGTGAAQFPAFSDAVQPFGYLLAQAGPTLASPWTFGVGNLSGVTGLTLTFRDVLGAPAQPIVS
jgi:hypothetical protein